MIVENELLGVPKLKIYQDTEMFNFSIDSIILASFVTIKKNVKEIIDLGTGNCPIPLYLTLLTNAHITGIEIQQKSYELAVKSVKINNREEQITLINDDLNNIENLFKTGSFDIVLSNPPFFKVDKDSNLNKNDYKTIARHEVKATLENICQKASYLLNNGGVFAMVHRPDRLTDILVELRRNNLEPKRIRFVYPKPNTKCNHVLIEAVKGGLKGGLMVMDPLYVHNQDNTHTEEVRKIYNGVKE
jgi:tRNA1(Val) A37 N6-methylase TrmN6